MPIRNRAKQCKAVAKSTGRRCENPAVSGFGVCRLHGAGNANKGNLGGRPIIHGRYSHRYQSLISDKKAQAFKEAMDDSDFLSLVPRIAILETRLVELLEKVESKESGEGWRQIKIVFDEANLALSKDDSVQFSAAWNRLKELINSGLGEYHIWSEISSLVENSRKLIETEGKRIKMMSEIVTMEDAKAFVRYVAELVRRNLDDKAFSHFVYELEQKLAKISN